MELEKRIADAFVRFGLETSIHGDTESFEITLGNDGVHASYYLAHEQFVVRLQGYPRRSSEDRMLVSAWLYNAATYTPPREGSSPEKDRALITHIFRGEEIGYSKENLPKMIEMQWYL